MSLLNIASVRSCTQAEGPGKRFAIWSQGCNKRCPGCCNQALQELRENTVVEVSDLEKLILQAKNEQGIEGVTFIGGEPVLQAKGFGELAQWCHKNNLSVLLFTGYLYSQLTQQNDPDINLLLQNTDLLVDGPFIQEQLDTKRDWIGSENQKLYFLTDRYKPGIEFEKNEHSMEILISKDEILINGWPFEGVAGK